MASRTVTIDCFPESVSTHAPLGAVVAVDVIRATTTAVTAVHTGRRCFPVPDLEAARTLAASLKDPLVAGEVGGHLPEGFHLNNSPTALAEHADVWRPLVLLSTSGTELICEAGAAEAAYVACLRNDAVTAAAVIEAGHRRVAVIGAGSRGTFRLEDQMCCALVAGELIRAGYQADPRTRQIVQRWGDAPVRLIADGASARYLRRSGQEADLEFVLTHLGDVDRAMVFREGEIADLVGAR